MEKYINKISKTLYDKIKDDYYFIRIYKISTDMYVCEIRSHNIEVSDEFNDLPDTVSINTQREGYITFNLKFGVKAWDRLVHDMLRSAKLRNFVQLTAFTDKVANEFNIIRESIISMICWSPEKERGNILLQIQDNLPKETADKLKKRYHNIEVETTVSPVDSENETYLRFPTKE